jgi:hypothetical protein
MEPFKMVDKHPRESSVADQKADDDAVASHRRPVDSIPGADDGEGLVILSDGRLRKVIRCEGLNSQSFDALAMQNIAAVLAEVAASLKAEIQVVFSNADVSEPEFLSHYRQLVYTDSEFIRSLSERSEQWFKQAYDSHHVQEGNQRLYLKVTCIPSPGPNIQQQWNGTDIHLPAGSLEECERQTRMVCDGLSSCGIQSSILNRRDLRMLLDDNRDASGLTARAQNTRLNDASGTSITATRCGTPNGMLFGFTPDTNEPVLFNPFFRGAGKYNNNILIAAAPSLQSIVTMVLILRLLPFGVRFILLSDDVGRVGPYRFLAELLGPEDCATISLEDGSGNVLNPFDLSGSDFHGRPSGDKIRSLLSFFDLILSPEGRDELSVQEKALLDRLIKKAYEEALTRSTVPTMSEFTDLVEQVATEESDSVKRNLLQNMAYGLSLFTKSGAYSSFLDGQTNIDCDKKVLICETKNISGLRYQNAVAYTLNQFIEKEAFRGKTVGKRTALLVHPSTGLMMSAPGLRMLENLSAGTRQHAMMFGVVTDQLRTLCSKTPGLIKHSQTKIFLPQETDEVSVLKSELKLTDAQVQSITNFSLNDGSLMCCLNIGDTSGIAKLTLNPLEHWICTPDAITDMPERWQKIKEIKTQYLDLSHTEAVRMAVYSLSKENKASN